jgi:metal-dependent amidase/aminoacylase/carboxypeptidase family protein
MMAGGAFFDITVTGKGSHGARPEEGIDPVLTACHVTTASKRLSLATSDLRTQRC